MFKNNDIEILFNELAVKRVLPDPEEIEYQEVLKKVQELLRKNGHFDLWERFYDLDSKRGCILISTAYRQAFCDGVNIARSCKMSK